MTKAKANAARYRVTIRNSSWEIITQEEGDEATLGPILDECLGPGHGIEVARTRRALPVKTDHGCDRLVQISQPAV